LNNLSTDLHLLAEEAVARALRLGATDAEAIAIESEEFGVHVRLGQVEQLTESGSRALGLRVLFASPEGMRTANTSTSDLSPDGITRIIESAVELAKITGPDPFAGLPDRSAFGSNDAESLALYFTDVDAIPPAERIQIARRCEAAAMAHDARIQNSKGASFDASNSHRIMVNSRGFSGEYRRSYCGFSASPIAQDSSGAMQGDYWYSSARSALLLESPPPPRRTPRPHPAVLRRLRTRDRPRPHGQPHLGRRRRQHL
jgi:PmbA protein